MEIISIFLLIFLIDQNRAARILCVYPVPSTSHLIFFHTLTNAILNRGHEVTVVTPNRMYQQGQSPPNLTEIDTHDVSYKIWHDKFITMPRGTKHGIRNQIKVAFEIIPEIFDKQMKTEQVQGLLQDNKKFDLILAESSARLSLVFSHIYKVPVIQISSLASAYGFYETIGAPVHPLLYTSMVRLRLSNLTMYEKITELFNYYYIEFMLRMSEDAENKMIKRYSADYPSLSELRNNVHMFFMNLYPILDGNRPVPPSVNFIGGIHQVAPKQLPEDLKTYLDSSKNGVIYMSFGTNVIPSQLPPNIVKILVKVLSQMPYDVLWKWDQDELPGRSKNIKISKWFPQADLLRHPNIKLFITQGGLHSTEEAIAAGVPLIGIPLLADQWLNTEYYVYYKFGMKLETEFLTEKLFRSAIENVIGDESYSHNTLKFRSLVLDQPQTTMERTMWWIEHMVKHGGSHLRTTAANISWSQYLEFDVILLVLSVLFAMVLLFCYTVKVLINCILKKIVKFKTKTN